MKIYIQKNRLSTWINITEYQDGVISMIETVDGTYNKLIIELLTGSQVGYIDTTRPIPPEYIIKLVSKNAETEIEGYNTFYFKTKDNNKATKRKKKEGSFDAIYYHKLECEDLNSDLKKFLPNYTIRQPKTEFFSTFNKSYGKEFILKHKVVQNGNLIYLNKGTENELATINNDNNFKVEYDEVLKEHYIEFNEIDQVGLNINFVMNMAKTANITAKYKFLGVSLNDGITVNFLENKRVSSYDLEIKKYYFNGDFSYLLPYDKENIDLFYSGGYGEGEGGIGLDGAIRLRKVTSLGNLMVSENQIVIPKRQDNTKCRIYFNIKNSPKEEMYVFHAGYPAEIPSEISGYPNDSYTKSMVDSIVIKATTSSYDYALEEVKTTLLEFAEKAIFDYNFNNRHKVFLSEEVKVLLDVPAKESEWGDYTLYELLTRLFKVVGVKPVLRYNGLIDYIKTNRVSRYIDLDMNKTLEQEHLADNYYDKVISNSKNLVSQKDITTEILTVQSTEQEFSKVSETNAGFKTSNDIYYVVDAVLYAPNLTFEFTNGEKINTNIGKPFYWNITERLFEHDIYESFPNVRADFVVNENELNPRSQKDLLTQGNTISYKSGGSIISKLFNLPDYVPDYRWFDEFIGTVPPNQTPEFAIVEMLASFAFGMLADPFGVNVLRSDVKFKEIMNYQLELKYVPIFNEITTKYVSNMPERKGLNLEKKLNITNRTISYDENEQVLRNEMELKGNVKEVFTELYNRIEDVIPYNSIANDNLYITSRNISIQKNIITVEYSIQKNFILQDDDIGLPVNYERYNVPYEYVKREVMIENHYIFSKDVTFKYSNDKTITTIELLKRTMFSNIGGNELNGALYAINNLDDRKFLMRISKLETRFTMLMSGMFVDNYSAGNQRYEGSTEDLFYSTPYRYTKPNGKVDSFKGLELGYNNSVNAMPNRLGLGTVKYNMNYFPAGRIYNNNAVINVKLVDTKEEVMIRKDAGEQIAITHTSYLENEGQDLKFYNFKNVNKIGRLVGDIELNDNLLLDQINYSNITDSFTFELEEMFVNSYSLEIKGIDNTLYENGIVLINSERGNDTLVGVVKQPEKTNDGFIIYIYNSQYGYYEDVIDTSIDMEIENINEVDYTIDVSKIFTINMNISNANNVSYFNNFDKMPVYIIDIDNYNRVNYFTSINTLFSINFDIDNTNIMYYNTDIDAPTLKMSIINQNLISYKVSIEAPTLKMAITNQNLVSYNTDVDAPTYNMSIDNINGVSYFIGTTTSEYISMNISNINNVSYFATTNIGTYISMEIDNINNVSYNTSILIPSLNMLIDNTNNVSYFTSTNIPINISMKMEIDNINNVSYNTSVIIPSYNMVIDNTNIMSYNTSVIIPTYHMSIDETSYISYRASVIKKTLKWAYLAQHTGNICFTAGYNPIGTSCSVEGKTQVVSGEDIGMSGSCHVLICKGEI